MSKLGLVVLGASGRMGRAVVQASSNNDRFQLSAAFAGEGSCTLGTDAGVLAGVGESGVAMQAVSELEARLAASKHPEHPLVVVDFSTPEATRSLLRFAPSQGIPLVLCTTGLGPDVEEEIRRAAKETPIVYAANTSPGVTVLNHIAALATRLLGPDYDAEIVEMHHRHKVDAPSGTALRLGQAVAAAQERSFDESAVYGRQGQVGPRQQKELGMMTLRGGEVIGEHTLFLAGPGERLELVHRAQDRSLFAQGALRAASWVVGQKPGLYGMEDVLGIR